MRCAPGAARVGCVAGFDLTSRAPKSVSVLFAIGDDSVVQEIRASHQAAVYEALRYLEREACCARRGHGGATVVVGRGFRGGGVRASLLTRR